MGTKKIGYLSSIGALRGDYGLHNHPITQAIGKIVKKFEVTAVVTNIVRAVHHRLVPLKIPLLKVKVLPKSQMCRFLVVLRN